MDWQGIEKPFENSNKADKKEANWFDQSVNKKWMHYH